MPEVLTTTTTQTTTSIQSGIQLTVTPQSSTQTVGNYATDVTLQPYIANRIISMVGYNLRPNHRAYVHFDGVNVSQYCAPGIVPSAGFDSSDYQSVVKNGNWGDPLYTDDKGRIAIQFNIPPNTFRTGDRKIDINNVENLSQGRYSITFACQSIFTASNLSVTKQAVTLTTVNPIVSQKKINGPAVINTVSTNTSVVFPDIVNYSPAGDGGDGDGASYDGGYSEGPSTGGDDNCGCGCGCGCDPVAQALKIDVTGTGTTSTQGIYASSLDLYFKQKSLIGDHGVIVMLCEMNNGYPDGGKVLPFSQVHLTNDQINVSDDASVKTTFTFESPVFLSNNKEYAFIVHGDQGDVDFLLWTANLGDIDVSTGTQVFSQPITGTAFEGANMWTWSALNTEYIKFTLNRANFTVSQGTAVFNNSNTEYMNIQNIGYPNTAVGILTGDYVYKASNSTPSTANAAVYGKLDYYDSVKNYFYVENYTANAFSAPGYLQVHRFANSSVMTPNSTTLVAYANLVSLINPLHNATVSEFATIQPNRTNITYKMFGTANDYTVDTNGTTVVVGSETELIDKERIVASRSNEIANMSGNKSLKIESTLISGTPYLSPIIDLVKSDQLVIGNLVDPVGFVYDEYYSSGQSKSKYISQIVTLAPGQDAEDMHVIITGSRPPGSEILVYARFLNGEDTDTISSKIWTPLQNQSPDFYTSPTNMRDFKEFTYTVPTSYSLIPTTGTTTVNTSSANVSGVNTLFASEFEVGYWVNYAPNTSFTEVPRQIISITSNTVMTLNSPFTANHSGDKLQIAPPPTTAILANDSVTQLTGNVAAYTTNNTIVGTGTLFTTELSVGAVLKIGEAGDRQAVVSIANNTQLTVGTPWSANVSGANAFHVTTAGVTYLNAANNLFTGYKRFQIKIVLQSGSTSLVPILDDVRALALQL